MARPACKSTNLLKLVQERAIFKEEEKKTKKKKEEKKNGEEKILVPDLPNDCISSILIKLPIESLQSPRFVCKPWFNIINNSLFIETHLSRSEMVLVSLTTSIPTGTSSNVFHVDDHVKSQEPFSCFQRLDLQRTTKLYMQFMEIKDGKSTVKSLNLCCSRKITASCNGLVLLENTLKLDGSVVINPVTRKLVPLPLGTISYPYNESFGFFYSSSSEDYKVVHLFRDELGYVGCEIIVVGSRPWRAIDGPKRGVFTWFGNKPVFAIGALHWVPNRDRSEYIVSMNVEAEKFHQIPLPKTCRRFDGLVVMGGVLLFLNHVGLDQIDVWILKDLHGEWFLKHSITVGCGFNMVPVGCSRNAEKILVLKNDVDNSLYTYDFEFQQMKKIEIMEGCFPSIGSYIPHVNSLVSWS